MGRTLSDVIPLLDCTHKFAWPRKSPTGEYYQVCVRCGAEYGYDWNTMSRTERVGHSTTVQNRGQMNRAANWKPRARRLHLETPIVYRSSPDEPWIEGIIRNLSRSGVYFVTPAPMPVAHELEVIFTMPQEVAGQPDAKVFCKAEISRRLGPREDKKLNGIAIGIVSCEYLHERQLQKTASN